MKTEFFSTVLEKSSNIRFHENPLSGSRIGRFGRTDRPDEAKVAFLNFANVSNDENLG
jgi:hypothetical protein